MNLFASNLIIHTFFTYMEKTKSIEEVSSEFGQFWRPIKRNKMNKFYKITKIPDKNMRST